MSRRHETELRALRASITAGRVAKARDEAAATVSQAAEPALLATLRELKEGLDHTVEGADDIIESHPIAAVGAAFLLGFAVGRLMRGV